MQVDNLASQTATQISCGSDFCLALGQDCEGGTTPNLDKYLKSESESPVHRKDIISNGKKF